MVYEYISNIAVRPITWTASYAFSGIRYCSYEGNFYDRGGTGAATSGSTPPTHTTGAASDGTISWTYFLDNQTPLSLRHDTDEVILDNELFIRELVWRFKREREFEYREQQAETRQMIEDAKTSLIPTEVISLRNNMGLGLPIGPWSYPEGNYGL